MLSVVDTFRSNRLEPVEIAETFFPQIEKYVVGNEGTRDSFYLRTWLEELDVNMNVCIGGENLPGACSCSIYTIYKRERPTIPTSSLEHELLPLESQPQDLFIGSVETGILYI